MVALSWADRLARLPLSEEQVIDGLARSLHDPLARAISNMGERKRGIPRLVPSPGPRRLGVFAKPDKAG